MSHDPWSRRRRLALVALTFLAGAICFRSAFRTLRDQGPASWPLSLMLCVLASAAWMLTVSLLRPSRSPATDTATDAASDAAPDTRDAVTPPEPDGKN